MAKLTYLVIHNAATPPRLRLTPEHIKDWHMSPKPKGNGWSRVGYSDMINRKCELINLTPFDQDNEVDYDEMTWGVGGKNSISRHLVLEGGKDDNGGYKSPLKTWFGMSEALETYLKYTILRHPQIKIAGHYQFDPVNKANCPGFDIVEYCQSIGIPDENIYIP